MDQTPLRLFDVKTWVQSCQPQLVYITGDPCSGKSVITNQIVYEMNNSNNQTKVVVSNPAARMQLADPMRFTWNHSDSSMTRIVDKLISQEIAMTTDNVILVIEICDEHNLKRLTTDRLDALYMQGYTLIVTSRRFDYKLWRRISECGAIKAFHLQAETPLSGGYAANERWFCINRGGEHDWDPPGMCKHLLLTVTKVYCKEML